MIPKAFAFSRRIHRILLVGPLCVVTAVAIDAQSLYNQSPSQLDVPNAHRQIDAEQAAARPHLGTLISYGNDLRSQSGSDANTLIEQVSPGVGIRRQEPASIGFEW